jgi:PAS domain S-box-containing protein
MLPVIAALEGLEYGGFVVPMPVAILVGCIVLAAYISGTAAGLVCAGMLVICAAWHLSIPGSPFRYTGNGFLALVVTAFVAPLPALAIGVWRQRAQRAMEAVHRQAALEATLRERETIEVELERQRKEQQTLFHSVPAMIWFKDEHNRILRANSLAASSIGKTVAEVEGRMTAEFYPEYAEKYHQDDLEVIRSGRPKLKIVEPYVAASGERRWVRTDKVPYLDASGRAVGVIVFAVDITEQMAAREELRKTRDELECHVRQRTEELLQANAKLRSEITDRERAEELRGTLERRLQQIIDNTTAVVYAKDQEGRYLFVNRRFEELFHVQRESLAGKSDYALFPKEAADAFRANDLQVLRTGMPVEFEETAPHDDGLHHYISLKLPLFDAGGRPTAVCGISTDISDRKRAELERLDHTARLEAANQALAEAREAAEAASQAKSRFLANISHEIRTPIMAMLGAAELLEAGKGGENAGFNCSTMILRNGRHLLSLIDELLDVSRIDAGKMDVKLAECSLIELLADVEAVSRPLRWGRPIDYRLEFTTSVPKCIRTDRTRLTQALINLVNNAEKFTEQGHVWIRVGVERASGEPRLVLEVEDTGVGIRPEDRGRIFEVFAHGEPITRRVWEGVGLGLPIAKWIAERLGGSLEFESQLGAGSRFTLRTAVGPLLDAEWLDPAEADQMLRRIDHALTVAATEGKLRGRILLAEDVKDSRDLIAYALEIAGAEVIVAENGRVAVELAARHTFDLILLDIRMPDLDGVSAAKAIRDQGFRLALIALTASTSGRDREKFFAAGFDDVWLKPISLERLVGRIGEYLPGEDASVSLSSAPKTSVNDASPSLAVSWVDAVAEFRRTLPGRIQAVCDAVHGGHYSEASDKLHQLIGSAGIHGFNALSNKSAEIYSFLKKGLWDSVRLQVDSLWDLVPNESTNGRPDRLEGKDPIQDSIAS